MTNNSTHYDSTARLSAKDERISAIVPAIVAALFGAFLIWGVGFSSMEIFHNAAHDTRHSNAFPCH
jgi:cobalt transporter subunit CbtB